MKFLALAMTGGAIGSGLRYLVNVGLTRLLGPQFPWGIFLINVTGCMTMGFLAGWITARSPASAAELRAFVATGILGGYTTFSAFSLDFANLVRAGEPLPATFYLLGSVGLSIAGVFAGLMLARGAFT